MLRENLAQIVLFMMWMW